MSMLVQLACRNHSSDSGSGSALKGTVSNAFTSSKRPQQPMGIQFERSIDDSKVRIT